MNPSSERFTIIRELIGKGSSALVYKIIDLINNKIFAAKESLSKEALFLFKNEISIFNKFQNRNPYIVHFYNYKILPNKINLDLEYCQYGSLRDLLKKAKKKKIKLTENEISSIIYMVLTGLDFMHENGIINRDIKCKNILVNKDGLAKLCDFGISQIINKVDLIPKNKAGSPYWMAPELINMQKYNKSIDIWSLGITCIELAEYEPPYINFDKSEALNKIKKNPPKGLSFPSKWSKEFNDFVKKCLIVNKFKRPSCKELLKHDFIKNLDNKKLSRKLIILQMLSKIGCKVIYNKKTALVKNININLNNPNSNNNNLFTKTFYNTNNNFFKPRKNFFKENSVSNFNLNERERESPIKNASIQSSLGRFNLQKKILQKKIINLKYENFQDLNNSDNIELNHNKSPSIYRYMNFPKNKTSNRLTNHTINISLLNGASNFIKENNNEEQEGFRNLFLEKIRRENKRNQLTYNNSFNISEVNLDNFNSQNNIIKEKVEENNSYNGQYNKGFYYNPKTIQIQNKKRLNKTLNNQEYYSNNINDNRIIVNSNISRNTFNIRKNRSNFSYLQTNNNNYNYNNGIKTRGDLTLSTTLSK